MAQYSLTLQKFVDASEDDKFLVHVPDVPATNTRQRFANETTLVPKWAVSTETLDCKGFVICRLGFAMFNPNRGPTKSDVSTITCNEDMKGNAKCNKKLSYRRETRATLYIS